MIKLNRSLSARLGPDKGTARKRDDILLQFHTRLSTRLTHQTALSRSLADRSAVTTLDIELACDTLNSVAFDGHGPVKIDTRSMWTVVDGILEFLFGFKVLRSSL